MYLYSSYLGNRFRFGYQVKYQEIFIWGSEIPFYHPRESLPDAGGQDVPNVAVMSGVGEGLAVGIVTAITIKCVRLGCSIIQHSRSYVHESDSFHLRLRLQ